MSGGRPLDPVWKRFRRDASNPFARLPVTSTNREFTQAIDEQILRFFAAANVPFAAVENTQFRKLVSMLRSGFIHCSSTEQPGSLQR